VPASGARTRYAERRGLHIAYQVVGTGPPDIVLAPGFVSHVERIWDEPRCRSVLTARSQMGRLLLFDRRGVGLSDRVGAPPTVEATARRPHDYHRCRRLPAVLLIGALSFCPPSKARPTFPVRAVRYRRPLLGRFLD
jgi:pimeloyl-ACP methyl ester carboxylesterase